MPTHKGQLMPHRIPGWTLGGQLAGDLHGQPRQPRRDERADEHPRGSRLVARGPRMDRQRLHARLRRLPADRRGAGRSLRTPADVPRRARDLHRRLRRRRAGAQHRRADRARALPGPGRSDPRAAQPHAAQHRRAGRAARPRAGRVVGRQWPRRRARAAGRRRCDRGHLLALDLLAQRAGRAGAGAAGGAAARREPRSREPARPAGAGAGRRPACSASSTASCAAIPPAGTRPRWWASIAAGVGAARGLRRMGAARGGRRCCRCGSSARVSSPPPTVSRWP